MIKNNKTKEINQTGIYWPEKRTEVDRIILPFQTVETINESKADRDELTLLDKGVKLHLVGETS